MANASPYVAHVANTSNVVWLGDAPWELRRRALRPLWMPHRAISVDASDVRKALAETGAIYAHWTEGWDTPPSEWWYVCCDDEEYDLARLRKGPRSDIRKGLTACEVRKLEPEWFARNGYPVYKAAFRHYGTRPPLSETGFVDEFTTQALYPGRETWGAFVGDTLAAWVSCLVIEDVVLTSSSKSDPTFFGAHPNNAVLYVLTRHYLRERGLKYVSAGARVMRHKTNVQDFKERMGYRRVHCRLRVELSRKGSFVNALRVPSWVRSVLPGARLNTAIDNLEALSALVRIAHSCSRALPVRGGTQ
jgi:hypothetical protein